MKSCRKIITLIALLALSYGSVAQSIGGFQMDETELYAMTKQMGQFMRRFNYEEDQFGYKLNPKDPKYRSNEMRQKSLPILFDHEKFGVGSALEKYFIEDVTKDDSSYMTFLGGRWYAEVSATFKYKGKKVPVLLFLTVEKEGLGSKWVLTNVYFSEYNKMFPTGEMAEKEKYFLHPMSHELDFMNIYKAFQNADVIEYYASNAYRPDYLSLFFYDIKKGDMVFQQVDALKFHVFQIKDWYFEVSWFNRSGTNSGWLMSDVLYMPEKDKANLIKFYQP
ncbi:MAG: hypothetical protein HUK16_00460 [Bacteroidales bacterium]|nr:hypothetical protein [Bacteroidales bacterium]